MSIMILGGMGFIGFNLAKLFELAGYNIKSLTREEFLNKGKLTNAIEKSDVVLNCIGSANVGYSYMNISDDFDSNVGVVRKVLEIMRQRKLNRVKFINLSSAAVYGNPNSLPVKETDLAHPISPYGFHKHMSELILKEYSHCFGLKTLSLRIFSAYGNGQRKLLVWDLHQKILNSNGEISLFGTGNESRDFIHIDDIFQQLMLAISNANFKGEAINIANGVEVKIKQIAEIYKKHHPIAFEYDFSGENRPGDPMNWYADITQMKEWGYEQKVGIEDGVENYITWLGGVNSDS